MKKEDIVALVESEKSDAEVTKQLRAAFQEDASLFAYRFTIRKEPIFHYLLRNNRLDSIKKLLKNYSEQAVSTDRARRSLLHLTVDPKKVDLKKENGQSLLESIVKYCPELINQPDQYGDMPLHKAVRANNVNAVSLLLDLDDLDSAAVNQQGLTPFVLALSNKEIHSLFERKINIYETVHEKKQIKLGKSKKSLKGQLSKELTSSCSSLHSHSSDSSPRSSSPHPGIKKLSSRSLEAFEAEVAFAFDDREKAVDYLKCLVKPLLKAHRRESSQNFADLCTKLVLGMKNTMFLPSDELFEEFFKISSKDGYALLTDIILFIQPIFIKDKAELSLKIDRIENTYLTIMKDSGIQDRQFKDINTPDFKAYTDDKRSQQLLCCLWELTACHAPTKKDPLRRKFIESNLSETISGLKNLNPIDVILNAMTQLMPNFNMQQQIVANFLVWKMYCSERSRFLGEKNVRDAFKAFLVKNVKTKSHYFSTQLNHLFNMTNEVFKQHLLVENYTMMSNAVVQRHHLSHQRLERSFDELMNKALRKKRSKRSKEVSQIALEMQRASKYFYRLLDTGELTQETQDGCVRQELLHYINHCTSYFAFKVLEKPDNIINGMELMVELLQKIWSDRTYLDLSSIMILVGVMNCHNISRLLNGGFNLSKSSLQLLDEMQKVASYEENYKVMRLIHKVNNRVLPYLGLISRDITLSGESTDYTGNAPVLGGWIKCIESLQQQLREDWDCNETDIFNCVKDTVVDVEMLDILSKRVYMIPSNKVKLQSDQNKCSETLTQLAEYLKQGFLPNIVYQDKMYPPSRKSINIIQKWLKSQQDLGNEPFETAPLFKQVEALLQTVAPHYGVHLSIHKPGKERKQTSKIKRNSTISTRFNLFAHSESIKRQESIAPKSKVTESGEREKQRRRRRRLSLSKYETHALSPGLSKSKSKSTEFIELTKDTPDNIKRGL